MMGVGDVQKTAERISYGEPLTTGAGMTVRPSDETIFAGMAVAPVISQGGRLANQAAMSAGRAGERLAERVVPQVMERGGLPAQLLGDVSRGSVSPLDVYHGTPHTLPPTPRNPLGEFDASKIGTGEGAQTFGYGIYTAEVPTIAKEYQRKLGGVDVKLGNTSLDEIIAKGGEDAKAAQRLKSDFTNTSIAQNPDDVSNPSFWKETENFYKTIDSPENSGVKKLLDKFGDISASTKGNLYKIDLPDEKIATMLDWDKPLTEQNQNVLNAAKKLGFAYTKPQKLSYEDKWALFDNDGSYDIKNPTFKTKKEAQDFLKNNKTLYPDITGADLHDSISTKLNQFGGNDKKTAEVLNSYGVTGIKYLDQFSREAGQGTRNFVVFPNEEKSMTILERNGMPATSIENLEFTDPFGNTIGSSIR
jgi:hypothetical protein